MNNTAENEVTTSIFNVIKTFFNNTFIIDYGIIKDIPADGVVRVAVSVATSRSDIQVVDCVLATFASGNFAVKVKPEINDKVIVLYPKRYLAEMFSEKNNDFLICEYGDGYNMFAGIAFLANQFRPEKYKDYLEFDNDALTFRTNYVEKKDSEGNVTDSANDTVVTVTNTDGIKIQMGYDFENSAYRNELLIGKNDTLLYTKSNGGSLSVALSEDGATVTDGNGCTIEAASDYLTINGKLKVKNG